MSTPFRFIALTTAILTAACSAGALLGVGGRDDPALIIFYQDTTRIIAPDTVTRGVSFDVSFSTFGGGCIRSIGHDDFTATSSEVTIRAFDHNSGGQVCTDDLLRLPHAVQVRLGAPGTYIIRLIGQQRGASTGSTNAPAELRRAVTVR